MKSNEYVFMSCLGWVVFTILIIIVGTLMNGWALTYLWTWFVVPIFSVKSLTIWQAIGLSLIVSFLQNKNTASNTEKKSTAEVIGNAIGLIILYPILSVVFGWIVYSMILTFS